MFSASYRRCGEHETDWADETGRAVPIGNDASHDRANDSTEIENGGEIGGFLSTNIILGGK